MSVTVATTQIHTLRKRTSSFSTPSTAPPTKLQRRNNTNMASTLRRSQSMMHISDFDSPSPSTSTSQQPASTGIAQQQYRVLQYYKDQRLRRKALLTTAPSSSSSSPSTSTQSIPTPTPTQSTSTESTLRRSSSSACLLTTPVPAPKRRAPAPPAQVILPSVSCPITQHVTHRLTSPLSPAPRQAIPILLPSILARAAGGRGKSKHRSGSSENGGSLYRTALLTRMSGSPEGQKILHMGPRLALSIMNATRELERIVERQQEREAEMERMEAARVERERERGRSRERGRERERERNRERERCRGEEDFDFVMAEAPTVPLGVALAPSTTSLATPVLTTLPWLQDDWEMVECAA